MHIDAYTVGIFSYLNAAEEKLNKKIYNKSLKNRRCPDVWKTVGTQDLKIKPFSLSEILDFN